MGASGTSRTSAAGIALVVLQFGLLGALVLVPTAPGPDWVRPTAILLTVVAGVVLVAAAIALRAALTVVPEPRPGAPLITTGIYGWVRHPMYVGVICVGIALALHAWTVPALALAVALTLLLAVKARYEDRLLRDRWGAAAEDYQSRTGALLPRLR